MSCSCFAPLSLPRSPGTARAWPPHGRVFRARHAIRRIRSSVKKSPDGFKNRVRESVRPERPCVQRGSVPAETPGDATGPLVRKTRSFGALARIFVAPRRAGIPCRRDAVPSARDGGVSDRAAVTAAHGQDGETDALAYLPPRRR